MNGNEEEHLSRPRPLSGGIWTIFSWLRKSDRSSSDSVSSVGSDRTVASFDFLEPNEYSVVRPPLILPQNIPTDTYKRRLHDREIRRQRERDITIHRKYGLLRFGGYETFSHSATYGIKSDNSINRKYEHPRPRRATSECSPPSARAAHVPGKRRAPLPPSPTVAATLPRYKRKRRAPKPPNSIVENNKENCEKKVETQPIQRTTSDRDKLESNNKLNATAKKHENLNREEKGSKEKSFFKQLFENKKRNSAIDTSHVKFLPSISELDKQALEIIETNKAFKANMSKPLETNKFLENQWICTKCLRKYQSAVTACLFCTNIKVDSIQSNLSSGAEVNISPLSQNKDIDEKAKLKEMLREMKNSLPKRSKQYTQKLEKIDSKFSEPTTLRIGSSGFNFEGKPSTSNGSSNSSVNICITKILNDSKIKESFLKSNVRTMAQPHSDISLQPTYTLSKVQASSSTNLSETKLEPMLHSNKTVDTQPNPQILTVGPHLNIRSENTSSVNIDKNKNLITPLTISTLLNPIENVSSTVVNHIIQVNDLSTVRQESDVRVKKTINEKPKENTEKPTTSKELGIMYKSPIIVSSVPSTSFINERCIKNKDAQANNIQSISAIIKNESNNKISKLPPENCQSKKIDKSLEVLSQHSRRRTLVNKLEQSISKGDEETAAVAAAELAKLRLSCSVLSFSSKIAEENSTGINIEQAPMASTSKGFISKKSTEQSSQIDLVSSPKSHEGIIKKSISLESKKEQNITSPFNNGLSKHIEAKANTKITKDFITIKIWVEDKEATRGPVPLNVRRDASLADLMREAEVSLGLNMNLQRWIVGRNLCTDNKAMLSALAGTGLSAPFYLCLVEPGTTTNTAINEIKTDNSNKEPGLVAHNNNEKSGQVYKELMKLEEEAIVPNSEAFECEVCMEECVKGEGVILRECIHIFCKNCLIDAVRHGEEPVVSCPAVGCFGSLQDREIRALLSLEEYERWLAQSLNAAESGTRNTFHCRTTDCAGWAFCEPGVRKFPCPVCKHTNCIPCQALHEGETCDHYQRKLQKAVALGENTQIDEGTRSFLNTLIRRGEAIECPECNAIITKKWGCDWVKCSACKTEICWVTKGRRWGPGGKGDISGGCRCGVEGQRCHPSCGYCH